LHQSSPKMKPKFQNYLQCKWNIRRGRKEIKSKVVLLPCASAQPLDTSCPTSGIAQHQMQPSNEWSRGISMVRTSILSLTGQLWNHIVPLLNYKLIKKCEAKTMVALKSYSYAFFTKTESVLLNNFF
jgi:hypothetical protein